MVRRLPSGNLTWNQRGNGGRISVSKEQGAQYGAALATEDLQINADEANKDAEEAYMADLKLQQEQVDSSRPVDHIPVKPLYISVTDPFMDRSGNVTAGVASKTPWPEPLPELVPKKVFKSGQGETTEPIVVK